jgi:hypothetical protein
MKLQSTVKVQHIVHDEVRQLAFIAVPEVFLCTAISVL